MDVKLVVLGGKNAGRVIPITVEKFFIGRAEDCHLRPNTDLVSRHHCAITVDEEEVSVRDFGSRNGTLVNGERIRGEEELKSGDKLKVGPLEFEVRVEVALTAAKKPKVETIEQAAARTVEAAAKSTNKEIDIADWLADTVDGGGDTKAMDKIPGGDTVMSMPAATDVQTEAPETKAQEQDKERKKTHHDKPPSGIHGLKGPKAIDSKSAAADTLRAFFNRK
ncbi:MAG: FHA domain-containing protein [Pirellulaceae bacterium]|nr:FHA domain-containing protein [Pirellulaceae bacterium]